ncbi:thiamine-phosphate pyrophosphorylase [Caloramator fervidus]|uniref:Thiamine-phosphate synthase n=1 Tax=Caloramator fervidus TaxID=29344 RepID=A0A1H5RRC4_9CLOT|nr:thiamine phosphate synthase [Caloramator fervidus]SEF40912.1 thiamine-phosphate pyrophosphorylase [Caloramator fervidus]
MKSEKLKLFNDYNLYCITAEALSKGRKNIEVVEKMLKSGVKIIQYREKKKTLREKLLECEKIRQMTLDYGCIFIINDNIEIAKMVLADGVHIGQDDYPLERVREFLGDDFIIGISTHSREQLHDAHKRGADYIGVGPIFKTFTKEDVCDPVGYEYLDIAVSESKIPFVSIGGIKEDNLEEVLKRGAKCVAMVSEIVASEDIEGKIKAIMDKLSYWRDKSANSKGLC